MNNLTSQNIGDDNNKKELSIMAINEYNLFIEELRIRLNILGTSIFLLSESTNSDDPKQNKYLNKINSEMAKIRTLISSHSKEIINNWSIYK